MRRGCIVCGVDFTQLACCHVNAKTNAEVSPMEEADIDGEVEIREIYKQTLC